MANSFHVRNIISIERVEIKRIINYKNKILKFHFRNVKYFFFFLSTLMEQNFNTNASVSACFDTSSRALRARKRKKSRWNSLSFVRDPIMKNRVIGLLTMLWHFWIDITRPATVEANMAANEITREMPTRFVEFSRMILAKIRFVYSIKVSENAPREIMAIIFPC